MNENYLYARGLKTGMTYQLHANVWKEGKWYVATCIEVGVTSQGRTAKSAMKNLKEAFTLWLKYASPAELEPFSRLHNPVLMRINA